MSLILAFGLSPLGQVPAYADEPGTVAAKSTLQTQASLDGKYSLETSNVTYDGALWVNPDIEAAAEDDPTTPEKENAKINAADRLLTGGYVAVYYTDDKKIDHKIPVKIDGTIDTSYTEKNSDNKDVTPEWLGDDFTLEYQDMAGNKVTSIRNAGTYKVVLKGKAGSSYRSSDPIEKTFQVKPYDFKNIQLEGKVLGSTEESAKTVAASLVPATLEYDGTAQTIKYDAEKEAPYPVLQGKDVNDTTVYTSSDEDKAKQEKAKTALTFYLKQGDFDFDPPTLKDATTLQAVTLNGKGNFTGTLKTTATMAQGKLQTEGMLKVNGVTNSGKAEDGKTEQKGSDETTIDLAKAKKSPTVSDPDPLADGKVVFGETVLYKDKDFEVTYYESAAKQKLDQPLDSYPTAAGSGYIAVIEAITDNFLPDTEGEGFNVVTVNYDVTVGNALDEIAEKADFGSASYIAPSDFGAEDIEDLNPTNALVTPVNVKFTSAAGADVTSVVGDNWTIKEIKAWDEDKERAFLGEAEYAKLYPHAEEPYENTDAATKYFSQHEWDDVNSKWISVTSVEPSKVHTNPGRNSDKEVKGFVGLPAGDYELTAVADGQLAKGEVSGKFTVAPATAVEGTSAGQISIAPVVNVGYKDGNTITREIIDEANNGFGHEVRMVTGVYNIVTEAGEEADPRDGTTAYSEPLQNGSAIKMRTLQEGVDYTVTYMQDGQEVTPVEPGTYDAVFTFGGNNFAESTITKEGALVVGKSELSDAVSLVEVDDSTKYMYTGQGVEPKLVFYSSKLNGKPITAEKVKEKIETANKTLDSGATDAQKKEVAQAKKDVAKLKLDLKAGTDYTLTYRSRTDLGSTPGIKNGQPVGVGYYQVTIKGAGDDYTTSKNHEIVFDSESGNNANPAKAASGAMGAAFEVKALDLSDDTYTTVLWQDGDSWADEYSTVLGDQVKVEPKWKLVTTATKGDENPVEIPTDLYEGKITDNTGVGTGHLTITAAAGNSNLDTTGDHGKRVADFHIAAGSFSDEGVEAQLALTKVTDNKAEYTGDAIDLGVKVTRADGVDLAPQTPDSKGSGQYIYTITNAKGETVEKSTETADEAKAANHQGVKAVGKYTVTVTGGETNQYAGKLVQEFEVTAKEVKAGDIAVTFNSAKNTKLATDKTKGVFNYANGEQVTAIGEDGDVVITVDGTEIELTEAKSAEKASGNQYVVTGNKGKDAGTYSATVELAGNYSGSKTVSWKIEPVDIADMIEDGTWYAVAGDKELIKNPGTAYAKTYLTGDKQKDMKKQFYNVDYNGQEQKPEVVVYDYDTDNVIKGLDATPLYKDVTDAAPNETTAPCVTLVASGGNYTNRVPLYFVINPLSISSDRVEVSFDDDDLFYTGQPVEPKGTLTYTHQDGSKFQMTYGKDYTVEYSGDNVNVGGNATAKFVGLEPNFVGGVNTFVVKDFTVQENNRAEQTITYLGEKAITKKVGDAAFKLAASTNATDGKVEFASSDAKVATVDASGNVTVVGKGIATITITAAATQLFNAATPVEVKLTVNDADAAPAAKSANTLKIAKAKYKVKGVSKAKKTVAGAKVKVKGQGNVTWKKVKVLKGKKAAAKNIAKKVKVNKKTGKIVLKKGLKKGTYKVTVSAKAAGDATHEASKVLKAVVTLKVKK